MKKRVHVSWLISWFCAGILGGILASGFIKISAASLITAAIILALPALIVRTKPAGLLLLGAGMLIGIWRGGIVQSATDAYRIYLNKEVALSGVVTEDAAYSVEGDRRLRLNEIKAYRRSLPGTVWISTESRQGIKRSDRIAVSGRMSKGFGSNSAAMYRAQVQQITPGSDSAREIRDRFSTGVHNAIPNPEADFGLGLLTGQKTNLPEELINALRALGLTHIIVASGYNLTILVRIARRSLSKVSKFLAAFAAGSMIAGFTLVTGFSPSMSRAAIVAGLSLLAWYYGRKIHPLVLLPMAAAATALINPFYLHGDVGWYLSFASFAGVMILAPLIEKYFWDDNKKFAIVRSVILETSSAQLLTLPITILVFGQYSLLALPANVLVLPLIPFAMLLTLIAGLGGMISPVVGHIIGWPATILLHYIERFASWASALPWSKGEISATPVFITGAYLVLLAAVIYLFRRTRLDFSKQKNL